MKNETTRDEMINKLILRDNPPAGSTGHYPSDRRADSKAGDLPLYDNKQIDRVYNRRPRNRDISSNPNTYVLLSEGWMLLGC